MELAIDTSSNTASIALAHKGEVLIELTWQSAQNHTVELMPNLSHILHQTKVGPHSIEAVVVAKGPGNFNGLRIGVSVAKGLAFSLNIPLLGVSTLENEAYPFAYTDLPICPIHRAGREKIATALYQQKNDQWHCLEKEHLVTLKELCQRIHRRTIFCGELLPDIVNETRQNLGKRAIIPQTNTLSRAGQLATLGWQKLKNGEQDKTATLQPLYLRPPHITKPRKGKFASENAEIRF
ncbi:MAG: tRNA (adenosine(37)-N6)-threonylcarbamoyltransferase complex dimerization subunit type 1 TsaB [Dehalococcoidia bacterium]|nr:tRNA (adenosine(37)-N6)-threonylcarbamoyltransferase complex dimerization subunit type 1 TsaB [Dehalococcoidia bacterium]